MEIEPGMSNSSVVKWLLSSEHNSDYCAIDWIDPKSLRRIDGGTQPELNGYTWWFCTETDLGRGIPKLKKTMLCKEHSDQMLLEKFAELGFFDEEPP